MRSGQLDIAGALITWPSLESLANVIKSLQEWITAGVTIAIYLDPRSRTATSYTAIGPGEPEMKRLTIEKALLPGATTDLVINLDSIFDASL